MNMHKRTPHGHRRDRLRLCLRGATGPSTVQTGDRDIDNQRSRCVHASATGAAKLDSAVVNCTLLPNAGFPEEVEVGHLYFVLVFEVLIYLW
jgi:hypothetical protein